MQQLLHGVMTPGYVTMLFLRLLHTFIPKQYIFSQAVLRQVSTLTHPQGKVPCRHRRTTSMSTQCDLAGNPQAPGPFLSKLKALYLHKTAFVQGFITCCRQAWQTPAPRPALKDGFPSCAQVMMRHAPTTEIQQFSHFRGNDREHLKQARNSGAAGAQTQACTPESMTDKDGQCAGKHDKQGRVWQAPHD